MVLGNTISGISVGLAAVMEDLSSGEARSSSPSLSTDWLASLLFRQSSARCVVAVRVVADQCQQMHERCLLLKARS